MKKELELERELIFAKENKQWLKVVILLIEKKIGGYNMEKYSKKWWKEWIKRAGIRAIKTVCQTAIASIGTAVVLEEVNWLMILSASALAGVLSLLTSVAGLPELEE